MRLSHGLSMAACAAALLWIVAPAASHGPGGHGKTAPDEPGDAMKAQHQRMSDFQEATGMLSDAIIHNMMRVARDGSEKLDRSLEGHETDVPHKNRSRAKEFHGLYRELGKRTKALKKAIAEDDLPKAAVVFGRIIETCATCHRIFRD